MAGPVLPSSDGRARTALLFAGGLVATVTLVVALVALWPSGDGDAERVDGSDATTTSTGTGGPLGEPSERTSTTAVPPLSSGPLHLLAKGGADAALAAMVEAAGRPDEALEISVYPTYAFLAYRSTSDPSHIDRRSWRGTDQDDAAPNPIADRVDADTEPQLFRIADVDLSILPGLVRDAQGRFSRDVDATHVIVDRFLPFDERVLIRVYATPSDGRSGGGYVQYALDGTFVKVIE